MRRRCARCRPAMRPIAVIAVVTVTAMRGSALRCCCCCCCYFGVALALALALAVAVALAFVLFLIYRAPSARQTQRANTRRAAHRMCAVFRWHMDVPSKNARWGCGPGARSAEGALRGVLSFGYFSLHKQRKVTRASGSSCFKALRRSGFSRDRHHRSRWSRLKPLLQCPSSDTQTSGNSKGFRLAAGHFSLLAQRKVTKRKRALPRALRAARSGSADAPGIRGRGILPLPRTAHIHVRRPSGFSPVHPPLRKGTR
ncbi:hypothetical protein GGR77_002764 [Xanthomonas translucens]